MSEVFEVFEIFEVFEVVQVLNVFLCSSGLPPGCLLGDSWVTPVKVRGGDLLKGLERSQTSGPPPQDTHGGCGGWQSPPNHAMVASAGGVRVIVWLYWLVIGLKTF